MTSFMMRSSRAKEIVITSNETCNLSELFFGACCRRDPLGHKDRLMIECYGARSDFSIGKFIFHNLEDKNPTIKVEIRKLIGRRGLKRHTTGVYSVEYDRFFDAPDTFSMVL